MTSTNSSILILVKLVQPVRAKIEIINKIMDDKKLLTSLQNGARNSAELHSSKYFAEKVLDVYKLAINNRKPGYKEKITNFFKKVFSWVNLF